jgi:hypothetical protein
LATRLALDRLTIEPDELVATPPRLLFPGLPYLQLRNRADTHSRVEVTYRLPVAAPAVGKRYWQAKVREPNILHKPIQEAQARGPYEPRSPTQ